MSQVVDGMHSAVCMTDMRNLDSKTGQDPLLRMAWRVQSAVVIVGTAARHGDAVALKWVA